MNILEKQKQSKRKKKEEQEIGGDVMETMKNKNSKGITLVALVVTIVVLLILAGITITMLFGDNGIIKQAQKAKDLTEQDQTNTQQGLQNLVNELNNVVNNYGIAGGSDTELDENKVYKITDKQISSIVDKTIKVTDSTGKNTITLPKGFRIKTSEGTSVQQGIVISDSENDSVQGNEFVWIPVGVVTKDDGSKSNEIKLGRYEFNTTNGTPTLKQEAYIKNADGGYTNNYENEVAINSYFKELKTKRDGVASSGSSGKNATAKDLAGFVDSVRNNGGYYMARYEASCEAIQGETGIEYKLVSKVSNAKATDNAFVKPTTVGQIKLWNGITQINAALESRKMYNDTDETIGVKSDLINSYAWDTAIVYIQEIGNTNFANKKPGDVGSTNFVNTGSNNRDKFCNIYDMVANVCEWTTEYSTNMSGSYANVCVFRGGRCFDGGVYYTARRGGYVAALSNGIYNDTTFRSLLYVK